MPQDEPSKLGAGKTPRGKNPSAHILWLKIHQKTKMHLCGRDMRASMEARHRVTLGIPTQHKLPSAVNTVVIVVMLHNQLLLLNSSDISCRHRR
jgi:hypothetical protein